METLKVLCISSMGLPTPPLGPDAQPLYSGLEVIAADTALELARRGHEVELACSLDSPHGWLKERGVKTNPLVPSSIRAIPELEAYGILKARLKDATGWKRDLIIDDSHTSTSIIAEKEFGRQGPVLRRLHDAQRWGKPPPIEFPCFVCPSHGVAEDISAAHPWFYSRVVYHGLDLSRYPFIANGPREEGRAIVLGRVQSLKGVDVALNACEEAGFRSVDVVGPTRHLMEPPNQPGYVRSITSAWKGRGEVRVHGEVPHAQKLDLLQKANVLIAPSRFCLPAGTMISCNPKHEAVENVSANRVLTHTGRYGAVCEKFINHYDGPLIKIRVSGLPEPLCLTPNHRVYAVIKTTQRGRSLALKPGKSAYQHEYNELRRRAARRLAVYEEFMRLCREDRKAANVFGEQNGIRETTRYMWAVGKQNPRGWRMLMSPETPRAQWIPAGKLRAGDYVVLPTYPTKPTRMVNILAAVEESDVVFIVDKDGLLYPAKERSGWRIRVKPSNGISVEVAASPELFELMGYYVAEGSCSRGIRLAFGKTPQERRFAERCRSLIRRIFQLPATIFDGAHSLQVIASSTVLAAALHQWFGKRATEKRIPQWIQFAPPESVKRFLVGYINGDGWSTIVGTGTPSVGVCTTSSVLAEQVTLLAVKAGLHPYVRRRMPPAKAFGKNPRWEITFAGDDVGALWAWGVKKDRGGTVPVRKDRRHRHSANDDGKSLWMRIAEVAQKQFSGSVYNLEVKDDHSYRANWVPVHNCEPFGLQTAEAMACGTIPVVSKQGGMAEQVRGIGFTFGTPAELLDRLETVSLMSPEEERALRARCRARVEEKFTVRKMVDRLLELGNDARDRPW